MAFEIERKFLVKDHSYVAMADSAKILRQAYLSTRPESTVRVRTVDKCGYLTVKSKNIGAIRHEWEYEIPYDDALEMMSNCAATPVIEKIRYNVGRWEIDEFRNSLSGLTIAEIELKDENEKIAIPEFIGEEITGDSRYYNSVIAMTGKIPD